MIVYFKFTVGDEHRKLMGGRGRGVAGGGGGLRPRSLPYIRY